MSRTPLTRLMVIAAVGALVLRFALAAHAQVPTGSIAPISAVGGERIDSFASDITVRQDGTIAVIERIDYRFDAPRHGIYRDIPTRYQSDDGRIFDFPLTIGGVTDGAGHDWTYSVERNSVGLRIKIGDPNRTVMGAQVYVITYVASGALRYFPTGPDAHDELYWNVTGNGWTVPIARASATVHLPDAVPQDGITFRCYAGPAGSTSQDCLGNRQGRTLSFVASDAMTVVVGWAPGIVGHIEAQPVPTSLFGIPYDALPFGVPLLVFVALFARWWRKGRDPRGQETLVVQYDPPDGIRPGEMGTLIDESADMQDILATIVDLAVRGYLKIREVETKILFIKGVDYEFVRLKDYVGDANLKLFEIAILDVLFSGWDAVTVAHLKATHAFYGKIDGITQKYYDSVGSLGYFDGNPQVRRSAGALMGVATAFVGFFFVTAVTQALTSEARIASYAALALTAVLFPIFGFLMQRRTEKGVAALWHAKGFHEYLSVAEKYRLQWQEQEGIFEKFLPYAMVFGVADKWTKAFAGMNVPPPTWYEGRIPTAAFDAVAFHGMLSSMNSSMMTAMRSSPARTSSGSGFGGGFSGGGGGGGGGGSW